jgi:hypothetical protein
LTGTVTAPRLAWPRAARDPERAVGVAFAALVVVAFVYLMWKGRGNTFFYDEWGWIDFRRSGLHSILASYNDHVVALPVAAYQLLFRTVGLGHYWVYRLVAAVTHLGLVTTLFVYARRRIEAPALLLVMPIAVLGSGWDYVIWGVSFGFVASLGLGIAALLLLERQDRRGDVVACALLVLGLACSEFVVIFLLGIAVELAWRERGPARAWVWAVPLTLYGAWWLGYHEASMWRHNLTSAPAFVLDMAAGAVSGLLGLDLEWGRPLLIVGLVLLGSRLVRPGGLTPRLAALIVAATSFWMLVALGRAQLGTPAASRYVYTGAVLIVLIAAEASRGVRLNRQAGAIAALVTVLAVGGNIRALTNGEASLRVASRTVASELAALQLMRNPPPYLAVDPHWAPVLFAGQYLDAIHALGSSPAYSVAQVLRAHEDARDSADSLLLRGGEVQVGAPGGQVTAAPAAPSVELTARGTATVAGSCVVFRSAGEGAALDVATRDGGLVVSAADGPPVAVRARRFAATFNAAPITTLAGGGSAVVRVTPDRSSLPWHVRISPQQRVRACAIG